jgi:hypothetical protein
MGPGFNKQLIYKAFIAIDQNGDKTISIDELMTMIFQAWTSELNTLDAQLRKLDVKVEEQRNKIRDILRDREELENSIKRNFPRDWIARYYQRDEANYTGYLQTLWRVRLTNSQKHKTIKKMSSSFGTSLKSPTPPSSPQTRKSYTSASRSAFTRSLRDSVQLHSDSELIPVVDMSSQLRLNGNLNTKLDD